MVASAVWAEMASLELVVAQSGELLELLVRAEMVVPEEVSRSLMARVLCPIQASLIWAHPQRLFCLLMVA
jgi:hypothetical protein